MAPRLGLAYHDAFLLHGVEGHIENHQRLRAIMRRLEETGWVRELARVPVSVASDEEIAWLHDPGYREEVRLISQQGGGYLDLDTVATPETYQAATMAVGASMAAARMVMSGRLDAALCLVRPPGHHALPSRGMGFCFFNNIAFAAEAVLRDGAHRIAIVDWDLHHGNGTQEMFYHRGDVLYFSIHQAYHAGGGGIFYPGTGTVDEVGVDAGFGKTINVPLPGGAAHRDYLAAFDHILVPALYAYKPELILVSAGFDAHHTDPLGEMLLTIPAFHAMASALADAARDLCKSRLVLILEGGYDLEAMAFSVEDCLRALCGQESAHADDVAREPRAHEQVAVRRYLQHAISLHQERLDL